MKILAINNYSLEKCLKDSKNLNGPAHHNWGCDYFIQNGHKVEVMCFKNSGGIKNKILNLFFCLQNIKYFNQFDIIIAFANPIIGWCALLKRFGIIKSHLYTFVHHSHHHMELWNGYDEIFFLSKQVMEITKKKYPKLAHKMTYIEWGPDLTFYESTYLNILENKNKKMCLISNGKTSRDLNLITNACNKINIPLIIITDQVSGSSQAIVSGIKGKNAISYHDLLQYMRKSSISIIPIAKERSKNSLYGLTSFLDALALGHPIIMSDNTNISVDIEKLKIGLIYKAGDESDFINKIMYMIEHPDYMKECSINARNYAENHSYNEYCQTLEKLIIK